MPKRIFYIAAALFFLIPAPAFAQNELETRYSVGEDIPLLEFLRKAENDRPVKFFYLDEWLGPYIIEKTPEITLAELLTNILQDSDIEFILFSDYAVIFFKDPAKDIRRQNAIVRAVRSNKTVENINVGSRANYVPGKKLSLRVKVVDENSLDPIVNASVWFDELETGFITNEKGEYRIALPGGEYLITHNSINYQEKIVHLSLYDNAAITIILQDEPNTLQEVVISDQSIANRRIGQSVLNISELKKAPSFLGEADLIKQIQLSSGVTTASEASSGFNVRGGGVDQNLVLYDGTPIFNTAHALGFFNAFNSEAIRGATFYKGGIPVEFGGRASSVLSIVSKEGDYRDWQGKAGIGLVTSDLAVGGPVKRDTSSLMLSYRSSYSDWMLDLLKTRYRGISQGSIRFFDGSLKYTHKIDKWNKLSVSGYTSRDKFSLASDTLNQWQNIAASARLDRTINENLFATAELSFGRYSYNVKESDPATAFDLDYVITYPSLKIDFNHNGTLHKHSFGVQSIYYSFMPGRLQPASDQTSVVSLTMPKETAIESALYFGDNFYYNDKLQIEAGVRLSMYNRIGPGRVYHYQSGEALGRENVVDSTLYSSFQNMKTYIGPEPRISLNYVLNLQSSIKIGYNRIFQYVHLISNSATVTPVDIWQLSNTYFRPQRSDQVSAGYFHNSKDNKIELTLEGYYKYQQNVLEFKDGASLILNPQLEADLLRGRGRSYGVEFTLSKVKGRLNGGLTYTFSRALRQVNGIYSNEKINEGNWYPSNADQPHVVHFNWNLNITRRIFFTGNFLYHTGRPISLADAGYLINGIPVSNFDERNNYRIPDYHRMDVAFVIEGSNKKDPKFESSWTFSLYNVYSRRNPYSVFFSDLGGGILKPYQLSLIGSIVPSISYNIRF